MDITELLFGGSADMLANLSRYVVPLLSVLILARCVRSMLRERYDPETWAYLYMSGDVMMPLRPFLRGEAARLPCAQRRRGMDGI